MQNTGSLMALYGAQLVDNGYHVIPIRPGSKVPGLFKGGQWWDFPGWQTYCDKQAKAFEVDWWGSAPGCAVGIAAGTVVGIDIDIMDGDLSLRIEKMAREMLGDTPALRIGKSPKRMLIYRSTEPFPGRKRHPLEVLCQGNQFLAYAIHPETGQHYAWPDESLLELDISRLPAISHDAAIAWIDAAYREVPTEMRPRSLAQDQANVSAWRGPTDPRGTLEAITSALSCVPNEDLDGASWIMVGNALKGALGEKGRELWIDWSRQSGKSGASGKSDTPERRWKGFRPHSIGAGTIYWLAEQRGWSPDASLTLNAAAAEAKGTPHPAAGLLDAIRTRKVAEATATPALPPAPARKPLTVPEEVLRVGGILGRMLEFTEATSISPQPFLALGAALCALGAVAGRRYATNTDLRTNLYVVGIADSGGGKDHARDLMKHILFEAGLSRYLGGEGIASGPALLAALKTHPCRLFQVDEFGKFLRVVTGLKAPGFKEEIWTNLTKLLTSANSVYLGDEYADQENKPRVDLYQPCACLYGATVPNTFWAALEGGATMDGSLARFLIFQTEHDYPDHRITISGKDVPADIIEGLQAITRGAEGHNYGGNLASTMSSQTGITPYRVPLTDEADAIIRDLTAEQTRWLRQMQGTAATSFISRFAEHTRKLALIRAVSDNPAAPVVDGAAMGWARILAEHCINTMLREARRFVADTEYEKRYKRVLDVIRKSGSITKRDLGRATQGISSKDRDEALRAMIESGQVAMRAEQGDGDKPTQIYTAIGDPDAW